jgi:hypothetical protein
VREIRGCLREDEGARGGLMCEKADKVKIGAEWFKRGPEQLTGALEWFRSADRMGLVIWGGEFMSLLCCGEIDVDRCLADEILWLNSEGIETGDCCCGHGERPAYVSVLGSEGHERMRRLGYRQRDAEPRMAAVGRLLLSFIPRQSLPASSRARPIET